MRYPLKSQHLDWLLFAVALGIVLQVIGGAACAADRTPIAFSIHNQEPEPVLSQGSGPPLRFSIHEVEPVAPVTSPGVPFSIHDAELPAVDPQELTKADCSDLRLLNQVLVFYASKDHHDTVKVKVCDARGCRFENRVVKVSCEPSTRLIKELHALKSWKTGDGECDHFRLLDFDATENAALFKEFQVKRADLPLLAKGTDPLHRKQATGLDGAAAAKLYNKWFLQPQPEPAAAAEVPQPVCVPAAGGFLSAPRWDYLGRGSLRQHLTDPRGLHHLPAAVVNRWSDSQVQAWHNWHHETMQRAQTTSEPVSVSSRTVRRLTPSGSPIAGTDQRITAYAQSLIRQPPAQLVASAKGAADRHERKKTNTLCVSGKRTNASGFVTPSFAASWTAIGSGMASSIRSRC